MVAVGPCSHGRRLDTLRELWEAFGGKDDSDGEQGHWVDMQMRERRRQKGFFRYLELCRESRAEAEAYLGGLLKPRKAVSNALQGPDGALSPAETICALTEDVLQRGVKAGQGDPELVQAVRREVKQARRIAQAMSLTQEGDPFSLATVRTTLATIAPNKKSVRLPRAALKSQVGEAQLCTWALSNLVVVMGLVPSAWLREVSPIRKRGPSVVTSTVNLRPVSYVDDLQGFVDAVFLHSVKDLLTVYAGQQQAGGKYDAVLMVIGMFMALQMRSIDNLPTFVQKADLLHGFDLAWRDAIRIHVWRAGVMGRLWLFADSCLGAEQLRIRLGPVVGNVVELLEFGVGQGRRTGHAFFQALVRPLLDSCASAAVGVGLDPPCLGASTLVCNARSGKAMVNLIGVWYKRFCQWRGLLRVCSWLVLST